MLASDLYVACYTLNMRLLVDCIPTGGLCGFSSSITDVSIHNQTLNMEFTQIITNHIVSSLSIFPAVDHIILGIQLWIIETG